MHQADATERVGTVSIKSERFAQLSLPTRRASSPEPPGDIGAGDKAPRLSSPVGAVSAGATGNTVSSGAASGDATSAGTSSNIWTPAESVSERAAEDWEAQEQVIEGRGASFD